MNVHHHIREARVFSISMTVFISICLWKTLNWIFALNLDTLTPEQVGLATVVLSAIVALVKFSYSFAMDRSNNLHSIDNNNNK